LAKRITVGMDVNDNEDSLARSQRIRSRLINWIFLPLPLAIMVIGLGIITGLVFNDNLLLQGPMKWIIGLALTLYGLLRSGMILNKLRRKKENVWRENS
jgi:hypothetical protein